MRAVSRLTGVSINTVSKLLVDAGRLCAAFHDDQVRGVKAGRVQVDEIWSFTYAKAKNVATAKKAPEGAGDTWTWTGLDANSKLIVSWLVGPRDAGSAFTFASDLKARLANRVQLTSDGLRLYVDAVEDVFGADVDYAQLVRIYGASGENETRYSPAKCIGCLSKAVTGNPDPKHVSTSYVERANLTMRMHMRRVHTADERILKEGREPHPHGGALRGVLQFHEDSQDAQSDTGDGRWPDGSRVGHGGHRAATRRG